MANIQPTFGQWLKEARKEAGFTQKELGSLAGCSATSVRKIEADVFRPSRQIAQRLVECLDVPEAEQAALVSLARTRLESTHRGPNTLAPRAAIGSDAPPNNLPTQATRILGRDKEAATARTLLLRDDVRLLTLTGAPGIGKTRLAAHICETLLHAFEDGIFFVPLALISDSDLVASTIARSLGVQESGEQPIAVVIAEYLRGKQLLLLLDNFEQVAGAAPLIISLISECPKIKVLVTSREVLHVRGEYQFPVPPLDFPDPTHLPTLHELPSYPSVKLFVERATAINPNFILTSENARAVAEVCARLDGLPLAIEIAAARTKLFSPQEMQARIGHPLSLLTSHTRDVPARQQTLRKAIDWSYHLLSTAEQTLFGRMAVFVGGCTLAAAGGICDPVGDLNIDVVDGVESLLDKSLVHQEEQEGGERRIYMLETLREYALERLVEQGDSNLVRSWHAQYYLALVEAAEPELVLQNQSVWLNRLENEHDNLRAALEWLLGPDGKGETNRTNKQFALRLSAALWRFWHIRGHLSEGRKWLELALEQNASNDSESATSDSAPRAKALHGLAGLIFAQGDLEAAQDAYRQALALWRKMGDTQGAAWTLSNMGLVAANLGHYDEARSFYEDSLVSLRQLGSKGPIARVLNNLGILVHEHGDYSTAWSLHEESMQIARELGNKAGVGASAINLGLVSLDRSDYARAREFFEESLNISLELGSKWSIAEVYINLSVVAHMQDDHVTELEFLQRALPIVQELGDKIGMAACIEGAGAAIGLLGYPDEGTRLLAAGDALRTAISAPLPPKDRARYANSMAAVQALMSEEAFRNAWSEGKVMPFEKAVEYALAVSSD